MLYKRWKVKNMSLGHLLPLWIMLGEKISAHAQDELIPDLVCTVVFEKVCYEEVEALCPKAKTFDGPCLQRDKSFVNNSPYLMLCRNPSQKDVKDSTDRLEKPI